MSEDATIRIVLQDDGGTGGSAVGAGTGSSGQLTSAGAIDYVALAQKRLAQARHEALINVEIAKLRPPPPPPLFDAVKLARQQYERDKQVALVHAEYAKLPRLQVDYVAQAKERFEREKDLAAVQYEYNKINPPVPIAELAFDPTQRAKDKRKNEQQEKEINAEYQRMYGEKQSELDMFLEIAEGLRGSIGGVFGSLFGSILDVSAAWRKMQSGVASQGVSAADIPDIEPSVASGLASIGPTVPADIPLHMRDSAQVPIEQEQNIPFTHESVNTLTAPAPINPGDINLNEVIPPAPESAQVPTGDTQPDIKVPAGAMGAPGGAAGTAAGGVGGAAGAIPVVAFALAIKEIQKALIAGATNAIKSGIGAIGGIASGIASADADPSIPIAGMGEAASQAGEKINEIVPGLGFVAIVAGETAKSFANLMRAIDATAQRYGEFSPQIAQAQAIAEIRHTMGDFRRAQEVGGQMAKYLMAQSDLQQKFEDIKVKMLIRILPIATAILEILEAVVPSGKNISESIGNVATPLTAIQVLIGEIYSMFRSDKQPDVKDPTEQLRFDDMFKTPGSGRPDDPGFVPRL